MNEMNGMACNLHQPSTSLPPDPVPAMAYVPYQQWGGALLGAERALEAGTLFSVLNKPFLGRGEEQR